MTELVSQGCLVEAGEETLRCVVRGSHKSGPRKVKHILSVGDRVRFSRLDGGEAVLEEVLPRATELRRLTSMGRLEQVLAANADQVLVIGSVREPPFRPGVVDRILVAAEAGGLDGAVCLNKTDLEARKPPDLSHLTGAGYPVVRTSAVTGEGLDDLREVLSGRVTVLLGHSGVGKSSLLGAMAPDLRLRVGELSRKTGRGRHTTTAARLIRLFPGADVVDTPGVREFQPAGVSPAGLGRLFPDFVPFLGACRFRECLHDREPGCGVKEARERGEIHPLRYKGYRKILLSLLRGEKDQHGRYYVE